MKIRNLGIVFHFDSNMLEIAHPWGWANFHFRLDWRNSLKKWDSPEICRNFRFFSVLWSRFPMGIILK